MEIRTLGRLVKELRKKYGYTSLELANEIGKSRSYMSLIENDKELPTPKVIGDIGEALGRKYLNLEKEDKLNLNQKILITRIKNELYEVAGHKPILDENSLDVYKNSGRIGIEGNERILLEHPYYDLSWLLTQQEDVFFNMSDTRDEENIKLTMAERHFILDTIKLMIQMKKNENYLNEIERGD